MLSVYFKSRKTSKHRANLQTTITVNGVSCVPFSVGLPHVSGSFDHSNQVFKSAHKDHTQDNSTVFRIRQEIKELYEYLQRTKRLPVTANDVKIAYTAKPENVPTLDELFTLYLKKKQNYEGQTIDMYIAVQNHLRQSFGSVIMLEQVTETMIEYFMSSLRQKGLGGSTINNYRLKLAKVIDFGISKGYIQTNSARVVEPEPEPTKKLFHAMDWITQFEAVRFRFNRLENARKLFLVQCYTGLSVSDLPKLTKEAMRQTSEGNYFEIIRQKTKKTGGRCIIPVLPNLEKLLLDFNFDLPYICLSEYNLLLKCIADFLGHDDPENFSSHVGRKTAGTMLLNNDVELKTVSTILGHQSVTTTEKYYAQLLPETVIRKTAHLRK